MERQESYQLAVFGDVLQRAVSRDGSRQVYGVFRESERLIQVLSHKAEVSSSFRRIGFVRRGGDENAFTMTLKVGRQTVRLEFEHDLPIPSEAKFYSGPEGLDERRKGLIAGGTLADKNVVVVGAGSLGSAIALELAQAGVGHFTVLDFDQLDTSNLSRHVCDLSDLGRSKAVALAERLRLRGVQALGHDTDVTKESLKLLKRWFSKASLVISSVDVPSASFTVNELVVATGTPALFSGAYERAAGAEIIPVRPNGPCLFCSVGFRADLAPDLSPKERRQAYQAADTNRMLAEPGLGVDINYIAAVVAAHALAILDPGGSRADLLTSGGFTLIHGPSRPRDGLAQWFTRPLETVSARVMRNDPCPVCGYFTKAEKAS